MRSNRKITMDYTYFSEDITDEYNLFTESYGDGIFDFILMHNEKLVNMKTILSVKVKDDKELQYYWDKTCLEIKDGCHEFY